MTTPLATFFTKIGFDIDTKSIAALDSSLARLETRMRGLSSSLQGLSDNKTLNAAARLTNAQARKMTAEVGLQRQQATIAKVQADVEKMRQKSVMDEHVLLKKRMDVEGYVAKANAVADKARASAELKRASAELKATPYAPRPSQSPRGSSPVGIGGMGINASAAIQAVAAGGFAQQAFKMANFTTAQPIQYEFITGSKEKAGEQIKYVNTLVDDLKLDLAETDSAYKQFLGSTASTIGESKTQDIFTGIQKFGIMMGANSDQMKRGQKAISQMLSKQKLSAEELECRLAA